MSTPRRQVLLHAVGLSLSSLLGACGGGGESPANGSAGTDTNADNGNGTNNGVGNVPAALTITRAPEDVTARSGSTASFAVSASGSGALAYQWLRDGQAIQGATSANYTSEVLTYADTGAHFSVSVTDANNTVLSPTATLTVLPRVIEVEATFYASFARLEDGTMWGWGSADALGVGNTVVNAGSAIKAQDGNGNALSGIVRLVGGEKDMFVVRDDGTLWGWGLNGDGELGDGTHTQRKTPAPVLDSSGTAFSGVVTAANGTEHTLALKTDGTVWAWGGNTFGQLGNGVAGSDAVAESRVPVQVLTAPGSSLANATQVSANGLFSAALRDDGTIWTWGVGNNGVLGNGTTSSTAYATRVETDVGIPLTGINLIACGYSHCLALSSDGTVWSWGAGNTGALGNGDRNDRTRPQRVTDASGAPFGNVRSIAGGHNYSAVLRQDGTVWTFGQNANGALGIGLSTTTGTSSYRLYPTQVLTAAGTPLTGIVDIRAHHFHVVALADDGTIWTWGANTYGQIGNGTTAMQTAAFHVGGL